MQILRLKSNKEVMCLGHCCIVLCEYAYRTSYAYTYTLDGMQQDSLSVVPRNSPRVIWFHPTIVECSIELVARIDTIPRLRLGTHLKYK
jgi:hypothetical protein